ncbi:MAG: sulfur carrier protein ThiS [Bacteroidales bacterium]|nr:sulfur carrier protein ThiS [Bacteroidales bacterium]MBD5288487.1 sulfur carrier protein ThiS [Bacteroides sp.]MBD5387490.1 sulfur carrier protein ThiS [bacterium]MDE6256030.1 sulfur carrier protein ThiS [Muribaculaceae bacterium]
MIKILINNQLYSFNEGITLADALSHHKVGDKGIAVALNRKVVSKKDWPRTFLHDNDTIIIISAVCGG